MQINSENSKFRIIHGDCIEQMQKLADEGLLVDSIVTDPPYHLQSIVSRFGKTSLDDDNSTSQRGRDRADGYARAARGFMGKTWDGGNIANEVETWELAYNLLKPGGHLLAFGGTRTFHNMTCAIEGVGTEYKIVYNLKENVPINIINEIENFLNS